MHVSICLLRNPWVARNRSCLETAEAWGILYRIGGISWKPSAQLKERPLKRQSQGRKSTTKAAAFLSKSRLSDSHFFSLPVPTSSLFFLSPKEPTFFTELAACTRSSEPRLQATCFDISAKLLKFLSSCFNSHKGASVGQAWIDDEWLGYMAVLRGQGFMTHLLT